MKKGVICAGGRGTRLLPATKVTNKHLVPILNKPMILYPLETLKTLGVTDILLVSGGGHVGDFAEFLGDGSEFGVSLTYRVQRDPNGIAGALMLAEDFVKGESVTVILGDNVFENEKLEGVSGMGGAQIVIKKVEDPGRFGVPVFDSRGHIKFIEEKPKKPKSNFAVTGLYSYPSNVFEVLRTLTPSPRGELEITGVNNHYISRGEMLDLTFQGFWSDCGTPQSMAQTVAWAASKLSTSN